MFGPLPFARSSSVTALGDLRTSNRQQPHRHFLRELGESSWRRHFATPFLTALKQSKEFNQVASTGLASQLIKGAVGSTQTDV